MKREDIILDTNVLLDIILKRRDFLYASTILELGKQHKINILIAPYSYTNIWYITTQALKIKPQLIIESLKRIEAITSLLEINSPILKSTFLNFKPDFEDSLIIQAAVKNKCSSIVTNNKKMLKSKIINCKTPKKYLELSSVSAVWN